MRAGQSSASPLGARTWNSERSGRSMACPEQPRLAVVFDGTCGPCTRCARWLRRRDRRGAISVVASQLPGVLAAYGLSRPEADRAAWAIEPDGSRFEGAAAVARALAELGGPWRLAASLYRVAPLRVAADAGYRWFAGNRTRLAWLGVTPECEEPGATCRE